MRAASEAMHYAAVYRQDGPVVVEVHEKGRWKVIATEEPTPMTYDPTEAAKLAEAYAQEIADRSGWTKTTDNYARIYQASLAGALVMASYCEETFAKAIVERDRRLAELEAENARLREAAVKFAPQWFYLAGDMSSDKCRFAPSEVIDEDWLWENRAEGSAVVQIETAAPCPDIWCVVRFFTEAEKDERGSDDEYEIVEFASEEEARAALAAMGEVGHVAAEGRLPGSVLMAPTPDFIAAHHGSLITLAPLTDEGKAWCDEHLEDDALWVGRAVAIEPRYFEAIADGIADAGLTFVD